MPAAPRRCTCLLPSRRFATLSCNANDAASWTSARIARLLALLVGALAEIISAGMDDDCAAEYALRANKLDELIGHRTLTVALAIGLEVTQVADVADRVGRRAVSLTVGVDYWWPEEIRQYDILSLW